jgi:hypothetical protein
LVQEEAPRVVFTTLYSATTSPMAFGKSYNALHFRRPKKPSLM